MKIQKYELILVIIFACGFAYAAVEAILHPPSKALPKKEIKVVEAVFQKQNSEQSKVVSDLTSNFQDPFFQVVLVPKTVEFGEEFKLNISELFKCDCDYYEGICEAKERRAKQAQACPCDSDCADGPLLTKKPCQADDHCDTWCRANTDPDCEDSDEYISVISKDPCFYGSSYECCLKKPWMCPKPLPPIENKPLYSAPLQSYNNKPTYIFLGTSSPHPLDDFIKFERQQMYKSMSRCNLTSCNW